MRPSRLALVALAAALAACASTTTSGPGTASAPAAAGDAATTAAAADQSRLSTELIVQADLPTAYDLVERLRRPWLRRQGAMGGAVVVYMDEQNIGGAEKLRDIPSVNVGELQYLTNDQAVRRWGNQLTGAVIVVVRRR